MVDAFKFLEGAQIVGTSCFAWLFQGRALELFGNKTDETKEKKTELDVSAAMTDLRCLNWNFSSQASQMVLDDVISTLEKGFNGEIEGVAWLLSAGPEYIKLLREGDIVAMVVLMHYGVLLARKDDIWWARYAGRKMVDDLSVTLAGFGEEYLPMIVWCRALSILPPLQLQSSTILNT
jgi:hypothetical protein